MSTVWGDDALDSKAALNMYENPIHHHKENGKFDDATVDDDDGDDGEKEKRYSNSNFEKNPQKKNSMKSTFEDFVSNSKLWLFNSPGKDSDDIKPKKYCCCNCIFQHRDRTIVFIILMVILFIFLIFVLQGIKRALALSNTTVYLSTLNLHNPCINDMGLRIHGSINNPSSAFASFKTTTATVSVPGVGIVGEMKVTGQDAPPGNATVHMDTYFRVLKEENMRRTLQKYSDGEDIPYEISAQVTVRTNAFVFPVSMTVTYKKEGVYIQENSNGNNSYVERVTMLDVPDPNESIALDARLHLENSTSLTISIPELLFDMVVKDKSNVTHIALQGVTNIGTYGPENNVSSTLEIHRSNLDGARIFVNSLNEGRNGIVYFRGKDISHLDKAKLTSREQRACQCYAQRLLSGVSYPVPLSLERSNDMVPNPTAELNAFNLQELGDSYASANFIVSLLNLENFFEFSGAVPAISIIVHVKSEDPYTNNVRMSTVTVEPFMVPYNSYPLIDSNVSAVLHNSTVLLSVSQGYMFGERTIVILTGNAGVNLLCDVFSTLNYEFEVPRDFSSSNFSDDINKRSIISDTKLNLVVLSNVTSMEVHINFQMPPNYFSVDFTWKTLDLDFKLNATRFVSVELASFNSTVTEISFDVYVYDDQRGNVVRDILADLFAYRIVEFLLEGSYGHKSFSNTLALKPSEVTSTNVQSFLDVKEVELLALKNEVFLVQVGAIFTTSFDVSIDMPALDLDVAVGKENVLVSILLEPLKIENNTSPFFANVGFKIQNLTEVVWSAMDYSSGRDVRVNFSGRSNVSFISTVFSGISFDVLVDASANSNVTALDQIGSGSDVLLDVQSMETFVLAYVYIEIPPNNIDILLGWGNINVDMHLASDDALIGRLVVDAARIGGVTNKAKDHVNLTLELLGPDDDGAAVRGFLSDFRDNVDVSIRLSGSISERENSLTTSIIDSQFTLAGGLLNGRPSADEEFSSRLNDFRLSGFEPLGLIQTTISTAVNFTFPNIGLRLKLPPIKLLLATKSDPLAAIDVDPPLFGHVSHVVSVPVHVELSSWNNTWDVYKRHIIDKESITFVVTGDMNDSFISKIIPNFEYTVEPEELTIGETIEGILVETVNQTDALIDVEILSDDSSATINVTAVFTQNADVAIKWGAIDWNITSRTEENLARIIVSEGFIGNGETTVIAKVIISGDYVPTSVKIFLNGDDLLFSVRGKIGTSGSVNTKLWIPAFILNKPENVSSTDSAFSLDSVEILGSREDRGGGEVTFPCVMEGLCDDLVNDPTPSNILIKLGVKIPVIKGLHVTLKDDFSFLLGSNGVNLGTIKVTNGITLERNSEMFSAYLYFYNIKLIEVREMVKAVVEGADMTVHVQGNKDGNFLSRALSLWVYDIDVDGSSNNFGMESAPNVTLELFDTTETSMTVLASFNISNPSTTTFRLGSGDVYAKYGHRSLSGASRVLLISFKDVYVLPGYNEYSISLKAFYSAESRHTLDEALSVYIWQLLMPLELEGTLYPPSLASDVDRLFNIHTFFTIPKQLSTSSFIKSFSIDSSSFGNYLSANDESVVFVNGRKFVQNNLAWPVIVSYFSYSINLHDLDGVHDTNCYFSPCSTLDQCTDRLYEPQEMGKVMIGEPDSQTSVVFEEGTSKKILKLLPGESGYVKVSMPSTKMKVTRLYDESSNSELVCADIRHGRVRMGAQADSCDNPSCVFYSTVYFDWYHYAMVGVDQTCGGLLDIDMSCPFTYSPPIDIDFNTGLPGQLVPSVSNPNTVWSSKKMNMKQSWRLKFRIQISCIPGDGCEEFRSTVKNCSCTGDCESGWFGGSPKCDVDPSCEEVSPASCKCTRHSCNEDVGDGVSMIILDTPAEALPAEITDAVSTFGYVGIKRSFGLVFDARNCQNVYFSKDGTEVPIWQSKSIKGENINPMNIDDVVSLEVVFYYDADGKRAYIAVNENEGSFDVDIGKSMALDDGLAWLGFGASTTTGFFSGTFSKYSVKNIQFETVITDGSKTTLHGTVKSPREQEGTTSQFEFVSRESCGRQKFTGGDQWVVEIKDSSDKIVDTSTTIVHSVNGHYVATYNVPLRGRYSLWVKLVSYLDTSGQEIKCNVDCVSYLGVLFVRAPPKNGL